MFSPSLAFVGRMDARSASTDFSVSRGVVKSNVGVSAFNTTRASETREGAPFARKLASDVSILQASAFTFLLASRTSTIRLGVSS
jgi:hypothetical protein